MHSFSTRLRDPGLSVQAHDLLGGFNLTRLVRPRTLNFSMHMTIRMLALALVWFSGASPAYAESVTLFRVFLTDGTSIVSFGEYARVGDRLVFSMLIGTVDAASPSLHMVNLPMSSINWTATEKYAQSARYSHYIENRAESDYATLAGEIAATLNAVALARDPKARLDLAVTARRRLASWPRDHFDYRADDVREMLGLLDDAISALRAAAGETSFSIDLVASAPSRSTRETIPLMRAPSTAEVITQAIAAAKATDVAADRISILRTVMATLDSPQASLPRDWVKPTRRWVVQTIKAETRIEKDYAELTAAVSKRATAAAERADVRGVQHALSELTRRDTELGRRRPDEINALVEQVNIQLDAARRLRLARDKWRERADIFQIYQRGVAPVLELMTRAWTTIDDIKHLAGSDAAVLVGLADKLAASVRALNAMPVPDELKPPHALLVSAVNLAETAVRTRRQATISGELRVAWDASSAAAGSMMLLEKAQEEMEAAVRLPEIR